MEDIKYELSESPLEDEITRDNIFDELNRILAEGTEDENRQIDTIMRGFFRTEMVPVGPDGLNYDEVVYIPNDDGVVPQGDVHYRINPVLSPLPQIVSASKLRALDIFVEIYYRNLIEGEDGYSMEEVSEIERFRANISDMLASGIKSAARQV